MKPLGCGESRADIHWKWVTFDGVLGHTSGTRRHGMLAVWKRCLQYAGLAQYNSYNNILWQNDPDHIELSDQEAYRSCVATSLTGSYLCSLGQTWKYNSPLVEAAIRSIPDVYTARNRLRCRSFKIFKINLADAKWVLWVLVPSMPVPRPRPVSLHKRQPLVENWLVLGRLMNAIKIFRFVI